VSAVRYLVAVLVGIILASLLHAAPAVAVGGEGEAWPSFNESEACGASYVRTPTFPRRGRISANTVLRGPFAAMFGRTVSQVAAHLVDWRVPGTRAVVRVHERVLPALEQVAETIAAQAGDGSGYSVDPAQTSGASARTLVGGDRVSRHTFGAAIDINADRNPYRTDNRLVTDLPRSWVDAFTAAGFCWGGDWLGTKDAMHFSWQGPAFTPGATLPEAFPPLTGLAPFRAPVATVPVVPQALPGTFATFLADADGDGVVDVVRVARRGKDLVLDVSTATRRYGACSLRRSVVVDAPRPGRDLVGLGLGDWDGRGGADLWEAVDVAGRLRLTVRWAWGEYAAETTATTAIPTPPAGSWLSTADFDGDGRLDLFIVTGGRIQVWAVDPWSGESRRLFAGVSPVAESGTLMLADRDGDGRPDLWSLAHGVLRIAPAAAEYRTTLSVDEPSDLPAAIVDAAAGDYDGDGRPDLAVFDGERARVWIGNTALPDGAPPDAWFTATTPDCGPGEVPWDEEGVRWETSRDVSHGAVAWLRRFGFAAGCDPAGAGPACPPRVVDNGELVAFVAWILDLEPGPGRGFSAAGAAAAAAGFPVPCPQGDEACWSRPVSRAEIAYRLGSFLAARSGRVPAPHRWVYPRPVPSGTSARPV